MTDTGKKILIVGDVMMDRYIIGDHLGESPEARVPLINHMQTIDRLGGAGNVANNFLGLEMKPVLLSVCGNDEEGFLLRDICTFSGIESCVISDPTRKTTIKKRIVDSRFNQFLRVDFENLHDLSIEIEEKLKAAFLQILSQEIIEAVIIQDYNKGCITKTLIEFIQEQCNENKLPLIVDPKTNNFHLLSKCTAFKPNLKELSNAIGHDLIPDQRVIMNAIHELGLNQDAQYFVTLADKGIFYMHNDEFGIINGEIVSNPDVSGAGDTVLAVITYGLLGGHGIKSISEMANKAGANVVSKQGVSPVKLVDILG